VAAVRAPAAYTPKHLADKILTSRSALEGERKQVTILFANVKGSMDLAEQIDPEEWHKIMDRFFAILSEGVHRFARVAPRLLSRRSGNKQNLSVVADTSRGKSRLSSTGELGKLAGGEELVWDPRIPDDAVHHGDRGIAGIMIDGRLSVP
jgi:class 3 adenylate cyclase